MKLKLMRGYSKDKPKVFIGTLEYTGEEYIWEYSNVERLSGFWNGFYEVPGLPIGQESHSNELCWYFKDRITPLKHRGFSERLKKLGLEEYNEWDYLVASGLRTATDTDELVKMG